MTDSLGSKTFIEICDAIAAPQPAPAGVAVAATSAVMGLCLLVKVLRIKKLHAALQPAGEWIGELQKLADDDCAAVTRYLGTLDDNDAQPLLEIPLRVFHVCVMGAELCAGVRPNIKGLISADVDAARELLTGAARAASVCLQRNLETSPNEKIAIDAALLTQRLHELKGWSPTV